MRYLITGGAGFVGRCITRRLSESGVAPTDIYILRSKECDLTRQEATEVMVARIKPDIILHLAAQVGGIGANRANPGRYFYANMAMGLHLMEAAIFRNSLSSHHFYNPVPPNSI